MASTGGTPLPALPQLPLPSLPPLPLPSLPVLPLPTVLPSGLLPSLPGLPPLLPGIRLGQSDPMTGEVVRDARWAVGAADRRRAGMIRLRLLVFALVGLLGIGYVAVRYVGLGDQLTGRYTVYADFTHSGGIFEGASVNYRGVPVGRVESVALQGPG